MFCPLLQRRLCPGPAFFAGESGSDVEDEEPEEEAEEVDEEEEEAPEMATVGLGNPWSFGSSASCSGEASD